MQTLNSILWLISTLVNVVVTIVSALALRSVVFVGAIGFVLKLVDVIKTDWFYLNPLTYGVISTPIYMVIFGLFFILFGAVMAKVSSEMI